ncbi:enduracididine biosynthesis enzyme MppR [Actinophytocola sp.]|uniref:enduracididine biosynthesis enzyme MppR n=1 Tax=Actinophytocola sp. TaxID=1872138 RepID=UPI002D678B48|nr:enduracididine biosynthesis enzyme MppR [Actinophytocola sp.]HYQ62595.1 enduracididine biosynthesis enzyme MppR [Actinophytocola sp.]
MSSATTNDVRGPGGFSLPLSPSGEAAMITPPPWHFSGEVVMVDYRVEPDAAARFLPPELDLGPDPGAAAAVFAQWQWCSDSGAELTDPARCQFAEFLILLGCSYAGRSLARCPYAWVDGAVPLVRGWIQGMPKQFGAVHMTRDMRVGRAGAQHNRRVDGTLSVYGRRVAEASVRLTGEVVEPPLLHTVPLVHTRMFPSWVPDEETTAQLVTSVVTGVEFSEVKAGDAELSIFAEPDSDLAGLAPVEIGSGYVFSYAETLCHGRLLTETDGSRNSVRGE